MKTSRDSFGPNANKYSQSAVHASLIDLEQFVSWSAPLKHEIALDVATGSGNVALALAPYLRHVVAYDLTSQMLDEVRKNALNKEITGIECALGDAHSLPFESNLFDIVTLRLAMHHFAKPRLALGEINRVLKPNGRFVFADNFVPDDSTLDRQINEIETLRDPSHVRCNTLNELTTEFIDLGFEIERTDQGYLTGTEDGRMDFEEWMERIDTPYENRYLLREKFRNATPSLRDALKIIEVNGKIRFSLLRVTILARKK